MSVDGKGGVMERLGCVVSVDEHAGLRVITLRGRLDVRSAADARSALRAAVVGAPVLYVDLERAEIGDATAVGVLIEAYRHARRHKVPVQVIGADGRTTRLLRRARLGALLTPGPAVVGL
jgi:anti-anti-sigma factor